MESLTLQNTNNVASYDSLLPSGHVDAQQEANAALIEPLTSRELEVLNLIYAGYSNRQIAEALTIAQGTVRRHINNIYGKLGAQSRTQALALARELGMLN